MKFPGRWFASASLQQKFLILLLPPYVLASSILMAWSALQIHREMMRQIDTKVRAIANAIVADVESRSLRMNIRRAVAAHQLAGRHHLIIISSDDPPLILASSHREWEGKPLQAIGRPEVAALLERLQREGKREQYFRWNGDLVEFATDLHLADGKNSLLKRSRGALFFELDISRTRQSFFAIMAVMALLLGLGAVVLGVVAWLAARQLFIRPLDEMSTAIRRQKDYHELLPFREGQDDLGLLGHHLNVLLRALKQEKKRFSDVVDVSGEYIWEIDPNGCYTFISPRVESVLGYAPSELIGKSAFDLVHEEDRQKLGERFAIAIAEKAQAHQVLGRLLDKNGQLHWISSSALPLFDEQGGFLGYRGTSIDVTQSKEYEMELVAARDAALAGEKAKLDFLSMMSHEVRTPMNGIVGCAELLSQDTITEEQQHLVEVILSSSSHMLRVLNDILDYAKIGSGKMSLERRPFALKSFMREICSPFRISAAEKGLAFNLTFSNSLPEEVLGDPFRLRQILTNLLSNAVKFTRRGNIEVTIQTAPPEDSSPSPVEISIRDTGIGMSETIRNALFHSFQQGDSTMSREFGGTGLGLAISKRLAEMMHGDIKVKSTPNQGSEFVLTFPLPPLPDHDKDHTDTGKPDSTAPLFPQNLHVLLAEDNPLNQKVLGKFLEHFKYTQTCVDNGNEAVRAASATSFDLILMDIQLPEKDGVTAAREILDLWEKRRLPGASKPIILAVTANAMPGDEQTYLDAGMDGYVPKPLKIAQLKQEISRCWARKARS